MQSVEDKIPAFSMWKMINETISALINTEYSESNLQKLLTIVKSKEFSNIFVYEHDPTVSYENRNQITLYYKAFAVWLLGKFFYLLSCEKLAKLHKEIRDVQWRILRRICVSQSNLYEDLTLRYIRSLHDLNHFQKQLTLSYFTPEPLDNLIGKLNLTPLHVEITNQSARAHLQAQLIKFVAAILKQNLSHYFYNAATDDGINCFTYVIRECSVQLKIGCFESYFEVVESVTNLDSLPPRLQDAFNEILLYFEVLVYDIFDEKLIVSDEQLANVINIIGRSFQCAKILSSAELSERMANFLYFKPHTKDTPVNLQKQCIAVLSGECNCEFPTNELLAKFTVDSLLPLPLLRKQIVVEYRNSSKSGTEAEFLQKLEQIVKFTCEAQCRFNDNMNVLHAIAKMAVISELIDSIQLNLLWKKVISLLLNYVSKHSCPIGSYDITACVQIFSWCNGEHLNTSLAIFSTFFNGIPARKEYKFLSQWNNEENRIVVTLSFCNFVRYQWDEFNIDQRRSIVTMIERKICTNAQLNVMAIDVLPFLASVPSTQFPLTFFTTTLCKRDPNEINAVFQILPDLIRTLHASFTLRRTWNTQTHQIDVEIRCATPTYKYLMNAETLTLVLTMMQESVDAKLHFIRALPLFATYVEVFKNREITENWLTLLGDAEERVRNEMSEILPKVIRIIWDGERVQKTHSNDFIAIVFKQLKIETKKSLQSSDYNQQITLLTTLDQISLLSLQPALLPTAQLLLYFIMIPTSKHSLIAVNFLIELAANYRSSTHALYAQYKRELCATIVELCAVNHALINYNLSTSLNKIALTLGYYGSKDLITRECRYLVPFLVAAVVATPRVEELINEVAEVVGVSVADLLASRYGSIFPHIFIHETKETFAKAMGYVERKAGLSGAVLRRRNFQVIINELLLNFHAKRDQVLIALKNLVEEEDSGQRIVSIKQIPDHLQWRFLGVLAYFDLKLLKKFSAVRTVLLSLTELLKFIGAKHITPLRFKILASLRTALTFDGDDVFEMRKLNCDVWDAFVRNCEIDTLGPQLASIFVALLPLMEHFYEKTNNIFRYLIIENESSTKDYIMDLFFVVNTNVSPEIKNKIRQYLETLVAKSFKQQLEIFLKYVTYETIEMRIHALRYVKRLLEINRKELDSMILGYNGIDPVIVDLLDLLTLACREKDQSLRLACGECIGELGAIEPTHLPRRYTLEEQSFVFLLTEDAFILNSLSELSRAFQTEKNTQDMDRFALAIQEILKVYGISPDAASARHHLWTSLPDAQKQLMLPLLSSRYTMMQPMVDVAVSPVFSSNLGTSFQSWIYNWTCSLIMALNADNRKLLHVCLPSLKQDQRTLMHFLPHILLHALLEGGADVQRKIFDEFNAVMSSFDKRTQRNVEIENVRPLYSLETIDVTGLSTDERSRRNSSAKVIFVLLDFLDRWTREWAWQKGSDGRRNEKYLKIKAFVEKFSKLQIAQCNYQCGEYPRALLYLEEYISVEQGHLSDQLGFLAKLYAQLNESDGVAGVTALQQTEPSLEQRILSLEVSGKLADAAACYERISSPLKLHHLQGLVQCYLDLDNINTALNVTRGAIESQHEYASVLMETQAEPLWRLGHYDDLDTLLKSSELKNNDSWGVQIGRALLNLRSENRAGFKETLQAIKGQQVNFLGTASMEEGAYQRGYSHITRLHILTELEQVEEAIYQLRANDEIDNVVRKLSTEWELRLKIVQESVRVREPILCLRRVALEEAVNLVRERAPNAVPLLRSLLGETWVLSAKTARAAGVHQQAYTYTLKAEEYAPPTLFLERAKLHWLREEHSHALTTLRRGLELLIPNAAPIKPSELSLTPEQRKICAKAKLFIASYNDRIANVDIHVNMKHYKEAVDMFREWEKSLLYLAQCCDRYLSNLSDEERDRKESNMQINVINYFGKSLEYGTNYVYQSMPRLLSMWFDYGTRLLNVKDGNVLKERENNLFQMTKLIDTFLERLPAFVFLTAFSQLVSRICHPKEQVYIELKSIIIKLLLHYPQQSLWMIISVIKSGYSVRSKRCVEILNDPRLKRSGMTKLVSDFTKLAEELIQLCNMQMVRTGDAQTASVSRLRRTLPKLLMSADFSEIMIPTQKFRKLVLPNPDFTNGQHNPFPNHYVHIRGIEDEIVILKSLQKPRRITLRGSDGKMYVQMLKPNDDLRRDFRLMEFNDIVNHLLAKEPESRQRRLNIRLYSVAPLNEECGMIEWIPNLVGLRPVLLSLYEQKGTGISNRELRHLFDNQRDPLAKQRDTFTKKLLVKYPPVLGEWFRRTFPDAQGWLSARTAYIRTTAAISMVGYILGLGDRHGENILLDSTNGDTVHVDFNCLFNKGETLEWPERVPFRLTHNMVAAMGPLGVEGTFRNSCASTLKVLRTYSTTLMSIVTPFVYDPLVSWPRNEAGTSSDKNAERTNEKAMEHIKNIQLRLQGKITTPGQSTSIALSVEGQTNYLIQEAMSLDNLCRMYIGWGPYL